MTGGHEVAGSSPVTPIAVSLAVSECYETLDAAFFVTIELFEGCVTNV